MWIVNPVHVKEVFMKHFKIWFGWVGSRHLRLGCLLLASASLLFCGVDDVVTFKGGAVSSEEVEKEAESELFKLKKREYEIKQRIARRIAVRKIIELEAIRKKVNKETLVEAYVEEKFQPPSEDMLLQFYNYRKSSLGEKTFDEARDEVYGEAVDYLKKNLKNRYHQELSKNYELKVLLSEPEVPVMKIDITKEPFWGQPDAKIVVVEYSDFECPYCQRMQTDAQRIRNEYKDKIKWVFKDFPLNFHKKAKKAHIAANCAHEQGKFFDYQEKLFVDSNLSPENLVNTASGVGLNMTQFNECLADKNGDVAKEIQGDIEDGSKNGVSGTPTVFVNGKISSGFRSYQGMKNILERELARIKIN